MKTTTFKTIRLRNYLVLLATVLILFSCKKEEEDLSTGFSNDIENFVPDSTIEALRELGMVINEGKQPPLLEGEYLVSPLVMVSSSVPNESYDAETEFVDYKYYLKNQDNDKLTLEVDAEGISSGNVTSRSEGNGAFISGYNDDFTAFVILENQRYLEEGDTSFARTLQVISGVITQEGIKDLQMALMMLDDYGDEFDHYIPVNTGRVFEDGDSIAYRDGLENMKKSAVVNENLPAIWEHRE